MVTFIRYFQTEEEANYFAHNVNGSIIIHYDWDDMLEKIVKTFFVKYKIEI